MKIPYWPGGNGDAEIPGIVLENDPGIGPSDGNNRKYNRPSALYDSEDWSLGWSDGRLGQPTVSEEDVLVAGAAVEREEELRKTRARRAEGQAKALALKNHLDQLDRSLDDLRPHYRRLSEHRNRYASESSLPLAAMYLLFGTLLFLADVPLSLLVAKGLGIPTERNVDGYSVKVSYIFSSPQLVLYHLWDTILLALGIALIGIIVKVFVDAVILREDEESSLSSPLTRQATLGISAAFGLFFLCTLFLGLIRGRVWAGRGAATATSVESLAFVLLTLTLPIVGGFCFSAGWRRLERAKHYYFTSFRLWRLEWRQRRVFTQYSGLSESVKALDQTIGPEGDGLAASRANLKKNVYLHGYHRGLNVPETRDDGEGLYAFCEKTLNRMLARKVRRSLKDI